MAIEEISLTERDVQATAVVTSSAVSLDIRICCEAAPDERTPMQRLIESSVTLPGSGARVMLGDLELYYSDLHHLAGISLYGNLAEAKTGTLGRSSAEAPPMWLTFPDLAKTDRDVIRYPMRWRMLVDRQAAVIELTVEGRHPDRTVALADRVLLSLDPAGSIAAMTFFDVIWEE